MSVNVTDYLDQRNQALWNELSSCYTIQVGVTTENNFGIYISDKVAKINVPAGSACIEGFTHELLHLHIAQKGVHIGTSLKLLSAGDILLSSIFPIDLWSHAGNCLEHVKMLPHYLQMGFDRHRFICDYYLDKGIREELDYIKTVMGVPGDAWRIASHLYLGRYFSMKACPNDTFDYTAPLKELHVADSDLFQICETVWQNWAIYDYTNDDGIFNSYQTVSFEFIEALKRWAAQKMGKG